MTKAELDRAYLLGVAGGQTGKRLTDNRYKHHPGRDGDLLRTAWEEGHASVNKPETTDAD